MYDMSALEVCSRQGAIQIHIHLYLLYTQHNGKLHGVIYLKWVKVVVKLTRRGFNEQKQYHNRQRRVVVAPEQTLICL